MGGMGIESSSSLSFASKSCTLVMNMLPIKERANENSRARAKYIHSLSLPLTAIDTAKKSERNIPMNTTPI